MAVSRAISRPLATSASLVSAMATATLLWMMTVPANLRSRIAAQDDTGLSSPEKAALTVLGLALAAVVAGAATAYVTRQTDTFK